MYRVKIVSVERRQIPDEERERVWREGATVGDDGKPRFGYAAFAAAVEFKNVEVELLSQTVENIDLSAVIKAINGL